MTAFVATALLMGAMPLLAQSDGGDLGSGMASYYGKELAGNRTANGERFDPTGFTAAHRTLPFGAQVRVTNLSNGRDVVVRVNDRGPFARGRIIDISHAAAVEIGMVRSGHARVKLEMVGG
ncbi:MAG: septal ring lytic transglycosylase RlpA family protein [Sphingomonadales bacterium]|nr:septal ring lytic transglycosylase RlpA family protein [Sphingomonadales bacterium]